MKSKLPIPEGEALVRRLEAQKLREHLDGIFAKDPQANVICYGDFNDTKDQPMFQAVSGPRGSKRRNTVSSTSGGMPGPSSCTENSTPDSTMRQRSAILLSSGA